MAIKQTGENWHSDLVTTKKKFIMDTEADAADLPKCYTGSTAISAEGGVVYMVNASGKWVKTGVAAFALAEEVGF